MKNYLYNIQRYFDLDFIGGYIENWQEQNTPQSIPVSPQLEKIKKIVSDYRDLKEEKIMVCLPTDAYNKAIITQELDVNRLYFKSIEVNVNRNNSYKLDKISKSAIKRIQFLHSLARDKKEFEYLHRTFFNEIETKKIDVDDFAYYVLALREIFNITKNKQCNIENISSYSIMKLIYKQFHKYLIFSNDSNWRNIVMHQVQKNDVKFSAFEKVNDYINRFFNDKEIKELVLTHYDIDFLNDKVIAWVKLKCDLFHTVNLALEYYKNQALFLEHDIDFNQLKINNLKAVNAFEIEIRKVAKYKLFTRLMQRLDAKNRQKIRHHRFLYNDYMSLMEDLYTKGFSFGVLEPVLKKIHTYTDCSLLLNALRSVMQEKNLYQIQEEIEKTKDAEVIMFDENSQIMIAKISSYDAMYTIGSTNWCITKDYSYYKNYCKKGTRFYIFYDAKRPDKNSGNPEMYGMVVYPFGRIKNAYNYQDRSVLETLDLKNIVKEYGHFMKSCFGLHAKC